MRQAADEYMLDRLRQLCELYLAANVNDDTVDELYSIAVKSNAPQLLAVCEHARRAPKRIVGVATSKK